MTTWLVIGPTCSGKTVLGQHLNQARGHVHLEASSFMRDLWLEVSPPQVQYYDFVRRIVTERGASVVAEMMFDRAANLLGDAVVTGLRTRSEVDYLQARLRRIRTVRIDAPFEVRVRRFLLSRAANTVAEFKAKEAFDIELGLVREPRSNFDHWIVNNRTLLEFLQEGEKVLAAEDDTRNPEGRRQG